MKQKKLVKEHIISMLNDDEWEITRIPEVGKKIEIGNDYAFCSKWYGEPRVQYIICEIGIGVYLKDGELLYSFGHSSFGLFSKSSKFYKNLIKSYENTKKIKIKY